MKKNTKKRSKSSKKLSKSSKSFADNLDSTSPPKPLETRVAGVSFSDYAEIKILGGDGIHDPWLLQQGHKIPKNYHLNMTTQPINVTIHDRKIATKKFTAADYNSMGKISAQDNYVIFQGSLKKAGDKQKKIIWPKFYQNPYQYQDYVYLQDIYANTICGRIFDTLAFFVLAHGIGPKIRERYENQFASDEEKRKFLDEHQWMIDELKQIDRNISSSKEPKAYEAEPDSSIESVGPYGTARDADTPTYDTTLQKKWHSSFILAMMFGRTCMVPRIDPQDHTVRIKRFDGNAEIEFENIPKLQLPIHPRDMGFNYVDYRTHRLLGIQLNNANWILKPDEMTFWEWMPDNPVYGSKFYGMSAAQSMMGAARTLRRIIEVDFPLIAKTRWSGMYWLIFKRKGEQAGTSDEELRRILAGIELNGINATLEENPQEDFVLHKIDLDPKISELLETVNGLIHYMISQIGMPQGLLYGEQDLNRDTLQKKISTWIKGPVKRYRSWFLEPISTQHYGRLAYTLAKQDEKWKKALEEVEVFADIEEFRLEDLEGQLRVLATLENIVGALKDTARAQFIDMKDLSDMIDPDKGPGDVPPMPGGNGKFSVTDSDGQRYGVESG